MTINKTKPATNELRIKFRIFYTRFHAKNPTPRLRLIIIESRLLLAPSRKSMRWRERKYFGGPKQSLRPAVSVEEPSQKTTNTSARRGGRTLSAQCFRGLATVRTCFSAAHSHTLRKKNLFCGRRGEEENVNTKVKFHSRILPKFAS